MNSVCMALLAGMALLWPWAGFERAPFIGLRLTTLLGLALLGGVAWRTLRQKRWGVTFELTWPWDVAFVCALLSGADLAWLGAGGAFLGIIGLGLPRGAVTECLRWSCVSAGAVALMNLLALSGVFFPASFDPHTGAVAACAPELAEAVAGLAICLPLALGLCLEKQARGWRLTLALAALAMAASLGVLAWQGLGAAWQAGPDAILPSAPAALGLTLAVAWLVARVAGKLGVSRCEDAPGIQTWLLAALALGSLVTLWGGAAPHAWQGYLLGMLAAYARARQPSPAPAWPRWTWAWFAMLGVAVVHAALTPAQAGNPRNYGETAARLFDAGDLDTLEARLDFIDARLPGETRTHYWRARVRLDEGDPIAASDEFVRAMAAKGQELLPWPTETEVAAFLVRLRDACAPRPDAERGLAYERALAAAGEAESALESLRLRAAALGLPESAAPGNASALAAALGAPQLAEQLEQWDPKVLGYFLRIAGG